MAEPTLLAFQALADHKRATLSIDPNTRSPHAVSPLLFGKFCEHLGSNIYHGMEAQILYNPTFGKIRVDEPFIRRLAQRLSWPSAEPVLDAYTDGAALGWFRLRTKDQVLLSPDAGPHGNQAQRFETPGAAAAAPLGIGQYAYLPLHRARRFEFRLVGRAVQPCRLELSISPPEAGAAPLARAGLDLSASWTLHTGSFDVPPLPAEQDAGPFLLRITAAAPANVVLDRVLLYPVEHVWNHTNYADLANAIPADLPDLQGRLEQSMDQTRRRPDLLRSFVHATELKL